MQSLVLSSGSGSFSRTNAERRVFPCWKATLMLAELSTLLMASDVPDLYGITAVPTHSLVSLACGTSALLSCLLIKFVG